MGYKQSANHTVSIYTEGNPYGYRYNLVHPTVNRLYKRYRAWKNIDNRPLTDAERFEFEGYLDKYFAGK